MTTRQVELIGKKEFATAILDPNHEVFVVHVAALNIDPGDEVYLLKKVQVAYLKADEVSIKVSSKYVDFVDIFFPKLAAELPKHTKINDHTIELVDYRQLLYEPIYSLDPVELEMLKVYIENNLVNGFIKSFKSPAKVLILFDKKPDSNLKLCVDS